MSAKAGASFDDDEGRRWQAPTCHMHVTSQEETSASFKPPSLVRSLHLTVRKDAMNEPEEANRELRTYAIAATSTARGKAVMTNLSGLGDVIKTVRRSFRSTHSALSTSSPIHEAIIAGNTNILNHLLALGYSLNIHPIVAPSRCLSPPDRHRILRSCKPRHPRSISQN
jgi:hypothetical protein